jgi:hypothetical protein
LTATGIIPIWIILSSSVIIYNNYLYNTLDFPYPVFTVTWHLFFAAIGTRVLQRTTRLLDGTKDVRMDKATFVRRILPIGVLFSGSLILSNTAYLYLSVSYIQMLKVRTRPYSVPCGQAPICWLGIHTRIDPAYIVDFPDTGSIKETSDYSPPDLYWRRTRLSRRIAFSSRRVPNSSRRCPRLSLLLPYYRCSY